MLSNITIQVAGQADAEPLSKLIAANAKVLLCPHYTDMQWNAFMSYYSVEVLQQKIASQQVFCAKHNHELVGTIALDKDFVVGFYTSINHQGQGIGTCLMNHIELVAKQQGLKEIQLAASPAALSFYYKNGWRKVRTILPIYAVVEFEETLMVKAVP